MKSLPCSYHSRRTAVDLWLFIDPNSHFPFLLPQASFSPDFTDFTVLPLSLFSQTPCPGFCLLLAGCFLPQFELICFYRQCLLYPERKVAFKVNCLVFFSWCLWRLVKISVGKGVQSKDSKSLHWDLDFSTSSEVPSHPMTQGGDCHCQQGKNLFRWMPSAEPFIFYSSLYSRNSDLLGPLFRTVFKDTMPYIVRLLQ